VQNAVTTSIQQLTYRSLYLAVLTWILGANPRAVTIRYHVVAAFIAGLLWFRGHATCAAISRGGEASHDALNRLLSGPALRSFLQILALSLVDRRRGYLVIDDVVIGKSGRFIEGIKYLFCPSENKKMLALNVVVLGWSDGKTFIPLTFRFWKKPLADPPKRRRGRKTKPAAQQGPVRAFDGTPFKTKIELAIDMLHWAHQRGFAPQAVLFDCYYLTHRVISWLKPRQWHWVSRIKEGRKLIRNGKPFSAKKWLKLAPIRRAPKITTSVEADLTGWGTVRVIRANDVPGAKRRFLVGSNPNWHRGTIERLYGRRWAIETAFRDGSQLLGLKDCQCRGFGAQENHFALVLMAYAFLQSQKIRRETAGDVITRFSHVTIPHAVTTHQPKVRQLRRERRQRRQNQRHAPTQPLAA
jgi:putative transposase